jgi:type II secretory pathway pseudopilin PulG
MVVFLVATSLILSAAVMPNLLTQGRREREEEMVWRGEQYERAIGLYFKKFGRYPTKIDDLTKQTNGVRFLRQAYTDPMNKEDGSWRFIYVGPNGQLIGSVHSTSLLQSMLTTPTLPGASALGAGSEPDKRTTKRPVPWRPTHYNRNPSRFRGR